MCDDLRHICSTCGLTFGSHRADGIIPNQCPGHEGAMDWPDYGITTFRDSGRVGEIPKGTPSARLEGKARCPRRNEVWCGQCERCIHFSKGGHPHSSAPTYECIVCGHKLQCWGVDLPRHCPECARLNIGTRSLYNLVGKGKGL